MKTVNVVFDPFALVIEAYESLFDNPCEVHFAQSGPDEERQLGYTDFPIDPSELPIVLIDIDCPIFGAVEVLAHELAHVAVGTDYEDEHGAEWEAAFDAIHKRYNELVVRNIPEGFKAVEPV